ncbi:uncharacterized protein JCM15063_006339 [Sporobolomyces koalae]|uniref:uncharacterized protein n=1 Tax=Sporobolomyces koalae TaxID=500713 RepID=UPI00316CFF43
MATKPSSTVRNVRDSLELSYKSTRLELSRILAFKAHLQQHGATQYGRVPRSMIHSLTHEMDKFDQVCRDLELRVTRAIATLERDARKASQPPTLETSQPPQASSESQPVSFAVEPIPSALPQPSSGNTGVTETETITLDEDDDAVPAKDSNPGQPIELDLTLSPTPPPNATSALALASVPASETTAVSAAAPSAPAPATDDLNALLNSLNMPAFDPTSFLESSTSTTAPASEGTSGNIGGDQSTADAIAALLATGSDNTQSAGGIANFDLSGIDFSALNALAPVPSASTNLSTGTAGSTSSSTAPTATAIAPGSTAGQGQANMTGFDFSGIEGLEGIDFSTLAGTGATGASNGFDFATTAGVQDGMVMSEQNLEDLLKSLGG